MRCAAATLAIATVVILLLGAAVDAAYVHRSQQEELGKVGNCILAVHLS